MDGIVIYPLGSLARSLPSSNSMTFVSNDPTWWPLISASIITGYFIVAGSAGLIYDWMLTFGQEVELVWVSGLSH